MNITYLKSASVIIEDNDVKILSDPWLVDGEYFGSWAHYPPCNFVPKDFDVDFIYITHIHPDHFSSKTLSKMNKNIPVIILKFQSEFLKKNIEKLDIVWEPAWSMDKMSEEAKIKIKNMGAGLNTPAPINYETALPQGVGKLVKQEDGSMVLANEHEQSFMVNQAIVDFWKSCNGQRKVTELVEVFAKQTGLQRNQVEKEVMQLLQQLRDGGLIAIAGQPDTPNVEFKK